MDNLKENPAKEKQAGLEEALDCCVHETNALWILASRRDCSVAMCQSGGKAGYQRTAVPH
jgi:hypothetical protein